MAKDRGLVRQSLDLLPHADRRKYRIAVALQMAASLLDLAGVLLFGVVGVLAATIAQGGTPPSALEDLLDQFGLGNLALSTATLIIAGLAAALLVLKGIVTLVITRRVARFLGRCAAAVSADLCEQFFRLPLVRVQAQTSQHAGFALSHGVTAAVIDVLSNAMVMRAEVALLAVLGATLLIVDPLTTVVAIVYFGLMVFFLTRGLAGWSKRTGEVIADTEVGGISAVQDGIATFREVSVAGHRDFYAEKFQDLRWRSSMALADQRYIGQIPRYVMEIGMVVGAVLLLVLLAATQDTAQAVGSLALFLTAATRVMPSLLRLNGARLTMHSVRGRADYAFEMKDYCATYARQTPPTEVAEVRPAEQAGGPQTLSNPLGGLATPLGIQVSDLIVTYPESDSVALMDVSFTLPAGANLALVGPSGAGKTTLADAILGVVEPTAGEVLIGDTHPASLIRSYPGMIAYVPQDVALVSGTIRDNVAIGLWPDQIDGERVWDALERARLASFLQESREGLDTSIGERGVRLSGGQRQRLGIARALYSNPRLLVLDEATSALDADTEHLVTGMLSSIGSDVTTVTVAHRLATIRQADLVLYLEGGRVLASGSFEEVRAAIPQFDRQAQLLGL